jgi:Cytochrome c3
MKNILIKFALTVALVSAAFHPANAQQGNVVDKCLSCHADIGSDEAAAYKNDVHYKAGVTCAGCHGGDPTVEDQDASMSAKKRYIGVPKPADIPQVCGKCHGPSASLMKTQFHLNDVMDDFKASVHGRALNESSDGPQCISCHGVHGILNVKDPHSPVYPTNVAKTCAKCHSNADYMKKFNPGLPVDQYQKYLTSVHGQRNLAGDPKPATCVSCHSNHLIRPVKDPRSPVYPTNIPSTCAKCHSNKDYMAQYHIPTDQYANYKSSVHGIALMQNSDLSAPACNSCHGNHGAVPPGVSSVASVCGTCHQANADLFDKSPHHAAFTKAKLPGCVVCHSNHLVRPPTDAMIGFTQGAVCGKCHKDVASDSAAPAIRIMAATFDSLTGGEKRADSLIVRAEQLGMDVSDASYSLKDVNQSLVQARVQVHSFSSGPVDSAAEPGMKIVADAQKSALAAISEYYFRRQGLGVSTLIITFLAVLLFLKIRQLERKSKR